MLLVASIFIIVDDLLVGITQISSNLVFAAFIHLYLVTMILMRSLSFIRKNPPWRATPKTQKYGEENNLRNNSSLQHS